MLHDPAAAGWAAPEPISLEREAQRLVVFSDPGVGKTTLAMSFPRPLVIDTDAGLVSVVGMGGLRHDPRGFRDLEQLVYWCRDNPDTFDTVVIDSFTELQQRLLGEITAEGADAAEKSTKDHKSVLRYVPEQGEYLANQNQLREILNQFRRLGKHVVLTAGVRMRGVQRTPDCSPGVLGIVSYWASVIGELFMHDLGDGSPAQRWLTVEPSYERMAKSRFNPLTRARAIQIHGPGVHPTPFEILSQAAQAHYEEIAAANQAAVEGGN